MFFNNIVNNFLQVRQLTLLVFLLSIVVGLSGCGDLWELAKNEVDDRRADYEGVDTINIVDSDIVGRNPDSVNAPTLYYKFTRTSLPLNSAPHLQRFNQELSGRPFQIEVYLQDGDLKLQDVTDRVLWNVVSQDCNGEPCYTINSEGRLIAGAKGKFSAQAEYDGLFTPVILFETPRKLETCGAVGNTDKVDDTQECLRIVMGSSGQAYGKWFTEPPRMSVMRYMWYSSDNTVYNSGYTHAGFTIDGVRDSGSNKFALMRNDGYDQNAKYSGHAIKLDESGQHARYCADLAEINFNGRSNWRKPKVEELTELLSMSIGSTYGWPVYNFYSSDMAYIQPKSKGGLHFISVDAQTGQKFILLPEKRVYATCVSEP